MLHRTSPCCLLFCLGIVAASPARADADILKKLLADLKNPKDDVKLAAIQALADRGPDAAPTVPALVETLQASSEDVRLASALALSKIGKAAVPALTNLSSSGSEATRYYALSALGWMGSDAVKAVPAVAKATRDKDAGVRRKAVFALGQIAADIKAALPALIDAFRDEDRDVRDVAIETASRFGPAAAPHLLAATTSDTVALRLGAVQALGKRGSGGAADMVDLLAGKHQDVRRLVAEILGEQKSGHPKVVLALAAALRDADEGTRVRCARALAEMGAAARPAAAQLRAALTDINFEVRASAFTALYKMDEDPRPLLVKLAKAKDPRIRVPAAALLFDPPLEVERDYSVHMLLRTALKEEDLDLRVQAAYALHKLRGEEVLPTTPIFVQGLLSKSPGVREQAIGGVHGNDSFRDHAPEAAPLMLDILRDDPEPHLKECALVALQVVATDPKVMVPALAKMLEHVDPERRRHALRLVPNYGAPAVSLMAGRLEDGEPTVRKLAKEQLRWVRGELKPALDLIRTLAKHKEDEVRRGAVEMLAQCGPETQEDLLAALKDPDDSARARAFVHLREQKVASKRMIPVLAQVAQHKSDSAAALFGLEHLATLGPDAFRPLLDVAKNETRPDVRARAIYYLGRFGPESKAALPVLIAALKDKETYVRKSAAASLAEMRGAAAPAIPHLIGAFQDENEEVRSAAAMALSYQGKECIPPVLKLLEKGNSDTRGLALMVLRNQNYADKSGVPVLIACLKDKDDNVRWQSCILLGSMGSTARDAAAALREMLKDGSASVREQAQSALKAIGE